MTNESEWEWFGVAGHFICGYYCRFHLATKVGGYLVSTVGWYWPEQPIRLIHAEIHDPVWTRQNATLRGDAWDAAYMARFGYEEIGCDRLFETLVFVAGPPCARPGCVCGVPQIDGMELEARGYNDVAEAIQGHMELCREWAAKPAPLRVVKG